MRLTILQLSTFVTDWRKMKFDDEDLRALEGLLLEMPDRGAVMAGTGGMRKLRFAPPSLHAGKSGSTRVGYAYLQEESCVVLVVIFAKNEKANLSASERQDVKALLDRVKRSMRKELR